MLKPATSKPRRPARPAREPNAPRADAQRNRDRLLASADAVFTERGADASLQDIATHAKLGIGTLYRHFPSREALLAAACDARLLALASRFRAASTDPLATLASLIEGLVEHAGTYRGLATSLGVVLQSGTPGCSATTETCRELLAQAQQAGEARRDVEFDDVVCVVTAISLTTTQGPANPPRIRRLVELFIDGLRTARQRR